MKKGLLVTIATILFLICPTVIHADVGVGVGTTAIEVDEELKQGMKYTLPPMTVMNTGDVAGEYTLGIAYHQDQEELLPPIEWFTFTPETFHLEPEETKSVQIELTLPIDDVVPGDYFAYVEGKPQKDLETGETIIGIAAAAKLRFTVAPSNIFEGIYYRVLSIYNEYKPYSTALVIIVGLLIIYFFLKKNFNFNLSIQKKESKKKE